MIGGCGFQPSFCRELPARALQETAEKLESVGLPRTSKFPKRFLRQDRGGFRKLPDLAH
jgi:hypothetical protein